MLVVLPREQRGTHPCQALFFFLVWSQCNYLFPEDEMFEWYVGFSVQPPGSYRCRVQVAGEAAERLDVVISTV